ncbi:hypothetical protein KDH_00810 [Dictyobacter sp. S3.2.2.5]|uniref:Uncharacterized protein n=1 Tax=Dictyobacter halimunensis TaxID=3026934 RepID=A0ABQ6FJS5_9CHLR|nr:hypothetical protein KDH_00810 [Dictyobacter sp. S3.2.2.5]
MDLVLPLEYQLGNWCKHFTGRFQKQCRAGIAYMTFQASALPCLKDNCSTETCTHASFPTVTEVQAQMQEIEGLIKQALPNLSKGICPQCRKPIERKEIEGFSQYAMPCRHRLGTTF